MDELEKEKINLTIPDLAGGTIDPRYDVRLPRRRRAEKSLGNTALQAQVSEIEPTEPQNTVE